MPQFVPEICEMIRLYFSRDGWGPLLLIALSHVVKRKGSGQTLCKTLHSGRDRQTSRLGDRDEIAQMS
jgi:hypothetical protein